jgi:hypothetical protein
VRRDAGRRPRHASEADQNQGAEQRRGQSAPRAHGVRRTALIATSRPAFQNRRRAAEPRLPDRDTGTAPGQQHARSDPV